MASKKEKVKKQDNDGDFLEAVHALGKEKGLEAEVLFSAIEAALSSAYMKDFKTAEQVRVTLDRMTGKYHVYAMKTVVEEVSRKTVAERMSDESVAFHGRLIWQRCRASRGRR